MKKHLSRFTFVVALSVVATLNLYVLTPAAYGWCGPDYPASNCRQAAPPSAPSVDLSLSDRFRQIITDIEHLLGLR